jgi:hypothetical protein
MNFGCFGFGCAGAGQIGIFGFHFWRFWHWQIWRAPGKLHTWHDYFCAIKFMIFFLYINRHMYLCRKPVFIFIFNSPHLIIFKLLWPIFMKEKFISISIYERETNLNRNIWVSHSGCWAKFQPKIQKLMLIFKSIYWVFLIEVFEVVLISSLFEITPY